MLIPDIMTGFAASGAAAAGHGSAARRELAASLLSARRRNDVAAMLELAETMRRRFPEAERGYEIGAQALRQAGRLTDAAALLERAEAQFPDAAWLPAAFMQLAVRSGAWAEVERRAAALRRDRPDQDDGYLFGLRALRAQKRFVEAASLLAAARAARPGAPWLLAEAALLAQEGGDFAAAETLWRDVRVRFPQRRDGYVGGIRAGLATGRIDQAQAVLAEAERHFPGAAWLLSQAAWIAQRRGDLGAAARLWENLRTAHPDQQEAYRGGFQTLVQAGRMAEAEAVLAAAIRQFPGANWPFLESAALAQRRQDIVEAERRLGAGAAALPDDRDIALRFALIRSLDPIPANRDWPVTLDRLAALNRRFPDFVPGWRARIRALRAAGAVAEAAGLARACNERMPDEPDFWMELFPADWHAAGAAEIGQLAAAADRFPEHAEIQGEFAKALAARGQLDEAERQYVRALQFAPASFELNCGHANIALRRRDWPEALRRWLDVQARFPGYPGVDRGVLDARAACGEPRALAAPGGPGAGTANDASIYWRFESLGGTGLGCEFGLVQRAGGAEPLGLLRWTHISPESLIQALTSRFEGVGDPAQTAIDLRDIEESGNPEYIYRDTRLNMAMHSFIHKNDMPEDQMFAQICRRMAYLRRQMIEDLEDAEKIFVYKFHERNLTEDELARLHAALRGYGDTSLLYVRYADAAHPSGSVEPAGAGLMVGYISGFSVAPDGRLRPSDLPAWDAICRAALVLHQSRRSVLVSA